MTVLADTSVWVEYLRKGRPSSAARLDDLLVAGEIVVCEVDGTAYRTGEHRFVLDPRDDLGTGFVLR